MEAIGLLNALQSLADLIATRTQRHCVQIEESFQTLPLPWTIAQLLDEEDGYVA